jgi:hypothetical protein
MNEKECTERWDIVMVMNTLSRSKKAQRFSEQKTPNTNKQTNKQRTSFFIVNDKAQRHFGAFGPFEIGRLIAVSNQVAAAVFAQAIIFVLRLGPARRAVVVVVVGGHCVYLFFVVFVFFSKSKLLFSLLLNKNTHTHARTHTPDNQQQESTNLCSSSRRS